MRFSRATRLTRLLALLPLLALAACDSGGEATGGAAAAPPPPTVTVATPMVRELVEWDEFTGRFEATEYVAVRARVSGYLDAVHFEDGQLVEQGQLLFVIDQRPFEVAVENAEAAVERAEASVSFAESQLRRAEELIDNNNISRATLDERAAERLRARADLRAAQAALHEAELDLAYTEIRAPVSGRISDRRVDPGNLVTSETLLTTIVALDPLYFVFDMSEAEYLAYQRAVLEGNFPSTRSETTEVGIKLIDEDAWVREGRMNFVDNVVDDSSGTVRARAIVNNPDLLITPGQFGYVRIPGSPRYPAVLVPDDAITTNQAQKLVMTVGEDNTVVPQVIRPGPRELGLRIVREGLSGDERVIINGLMRARPGAPVTPEEGEITVPEAFAAEAERG